MSKILSNSQSIFLHHYLSLMSEFVDCFTFHERQPSFWVRQRSSSIGPKFWIICHQNGLICYGIDSMLRSWKVAWLKHGTLRITTAAYLCIGRIFVGNKRFGFSTYWDRKSWREKWCHNWTIFQKFEFLPLQYWWTVCSNRASWRPKYWWNVESPNLAWQSKGPKREQWSTKRHERAL